MDSKSGAGLTARRISIAIVVLVVAGTAVFRIARPEFRRPVQWDELLTLRHYTWAGVNADGSFRSVANLAEFNDLGKVSLGRIALGFYCAMGRWIEPNNHVPHSVLTNLTLLLPCDTLTGLRLPALMADCLFALICVLLCLRRKWLVAAPIVAALAMLHPYCVNYSQESRGYALMMALCVSLILVLEIRGEVRARWNALAGAAIVLVSSLSFINIISMSVDWVFPVLLASLLWPWRLLGNALEGDDLVAWRRSLVGYGLIVVAIGFGFFIDRMPFVVSSARIYGLPFHGLSELFKTVVSVVPTFAPTLPWAIVCLIGLAFAIRSPSDPTTRSLFVPWAAAAGVSALHFLAARRLPYPRNLGFFLPPIFLGFGLAIEVAVKRLKGIARLGAGVVMVGILAWAIAQTPSIVDHHAVTLVKRLGEIDAFASKPSRVVLFGEVVDRSAELWLQTREPGIDPFAGSPNIEVVMIEMEQHPFRFEGTTGSDDPGFGRFDGSAGVENVGPYRIHRRSYAIVEPSTWNGSTPVLAAWIPKFEAVSLSGDRVTGALKEAGIHFSTVHHRYQAKVNVFDRLSQVYVPFDAPMQERNKATMDALMAVSGRFGGHVYLLSPQ